MTFLRTELGLKSDIGQNRSHNEDYVGYFEPGDPQMVAASGRFYIVADGVAGASAGEVASEYAVHKVLTDYFGDDSPDHEARLAAAIGAANDGLLEYQEQNPDLGRMSTTLVAALLLGERLLIANIGDSRAYLIRDGRLHQVTQDHNLAAQLVVEGAITAEEAESHPRRNILLRSLGVEAGVRPDFFELSFGPGDMLLLCSDGLTRHVSDAEIEMMTTGNNPPKAVKVLTYLANMRGGRDNITLLILAAREQLQEIPDTAPAGITPQEPDFAQIFNKGKDEAQ